MPRLPRRSNRTARAGGRLCGLDLALALAVGGLSACGSTASPADASDVRADTDASEGGMDVTVVPDVVVPTECAMHPSEDLAALAQPSADGLSYTGDNRGTPADPESALQPGSGACQFRAVHQRLFRYTLRTTAALRVSTDNPGSDAAFDSVLFVLRAPCDTAPPALLACNDDDPLVPPVPHVTLSLIVTPVLPAGTTVFIAVSGFMPVNGDDPNPAGELGTFELSVHEVSPVATGAACDLTGREHICAADASCVADTPTASTGTCRALGSVPGSPCLPGAMCTNGLTCDPDANQCYQTVAVGQPCDRLNGARARCGDGASCVGSVRGAPRGVCQTNGAVVGASCDAAGACTGAGLACHSSRFGVTCGTRVASGAACNAVDNACPEGEGCVANAPGSTVGACAPSGTVAGAACRAGASECDAPLFCILANGERTCRAVAAGPGAACGYYTACSFSDDCAPLAPGSPYEGTCLAPGTEGGPCNASGVGAFCMAGLSCSNSMAPAYGRCSRMTAAGAACDLTGRRSRCATGTTCVRQGTSGTSATCVVAGTTPGAACRATGAACDTGMTCVTTAAGGVCQRAAAAGDPCDPRFGTVRCPAGQLCRASALDSGTCSAFVRETEPNDTPESASALASLPAAMAGVLDQNDLDCFALDVPANGTLFASVLGNDGRCPGSLALDLYRGTTGRPVQLGSDSSSGGGNCPRIEGGAGGFPWAAGLPAGRYLLCVREATDRRAVGSYVLSVSASAR